MMHSVTLDKTRCKGCTACIRRCPTEAIRVRRGKATILRERCIDCGECIRACPYHAKKAVCDSFDRLKEFRYTVALPAPSLYGQFHRLTDIGIVLQGLIDIGFDEIYEVARAAEMISDHQRRFRDPNQILPVISAACPACVRLILQRFPKLIRHIDPRLPPVDLAALRARDEAAKKTGLLPEEIGIFFITPCPAKMTAAHNALSFPEPIIDGVLSMEETYLRLLPAMKNVLEPKASLASGLMGIGWAISGGESKALLGDRYISVDGIPNVISILEDIEDGKLEDVDFVELGACTEGCVGGCLTVENPFVAKTRIRALQKYLPVSRNRYDASIPGNEVYRPVSLEPAPFMPLDTDMKASIEKFTAIEELNGRLPGLDCSSCGAPSCRALAEDVVLGYGSEKDCIFYMRKRMEGEENLPPPFRTEIMG